MAEDQAIPEAIWREAIAVQRAIVGWGGPNTNIIARDLLAAELRGKQAERDRCIRIIGCGCERDHCGCPGNCAKDDIEAILTEP